MSDARGTAETLTALGRRLSRDTAAYAVTAMLVLPLSLLSVAVLTRYLEPAEFGLLAVMSTFAGLLTVLIGLATLQGTLMVTFGSSGDDELGAVEGEDAPIGAKREALGTGLALTVIVALVVSAPVIAFAPTAARLVSGDEAYGDALIMATASAAFGSLWRLAVNVLRMERRILAYAVCHTLRPLLVLAASIPLVAAGRGFQGALEGMALGHAASFLACMAVGFRSYAPAFVTRHVGLILRRGSGLVPVIMSLWVIHNADIFLLAHYASSADVGLYRIASRLGAVPSYFVSAYLMATVPLERTSLVAAVYRERGRKPVQSLLYSYFVICSLTLVLLLGAGANLLIEIAGPAYRPAAPLIPLVGLGFVMYGAYIAFVRVVSVERKLAIYGAVSIGCAASFVLIGFVLVPALGSYGAALTILASSALGLAAFLVINYRSADPTRLQLGRIGGSVGLFAVCYGVGQAGRELGGALGVVLELASVLGWPFLLTATGVVPRDHLRPFVRALSGAVPQPPGSRDLVARLRRLEYHERHALEGAVRTGQPARREHGETIPVQGHAAFVAALRRIADAGTPAQADARVGQWLLSSAPVAERDAEGHRLWSSEVEPHDVHRLEEALDRLKRLPPRAWRRAALPGPGASDSATACPICGSHRRAEHRGRTGAICRGCGAHERQRALARGCSRLLDEGGGRRCLEAGPLNPTVYGAYLRSRGWQYESVDRWRTGHPNDPRDVDFVDHEADLVDLLSFPTGCIDLFIAQHVLEEIPDVDRAIAEIARVLSPTGVALLEIPRVSGLSRSETQPADHHGNVWRFGADLEDRVGAHLRNVHGLSLREGEWSGTFFVCSGQREPA